MKIFSKYVCKQFFTYIILSLMLFTFILLMDKFFQLVNLFINKGINIFSILLLLLYSIPTILVLSMPMGIVTAGILTFGTMASDGEITAVRTSGISLKPVIMPIIFISLIIALLMIPFNYILAPSSQYAFRKKIMRIAFLNPALRIEESTLIEIHPYTLLCFNVNRKNRTLKEVIIYKEPTKDEPSLSITARSGTWHSTRDGKLILKLSNGTIMHQPEGKPDKLSSLSFTKYTITLMASKNLKNVSKNIESMTGVELKSEIKRLQEKKLPTNKLATRYYIRGALAGAIPVMILIGIPMGIRAENKGKTIGVGIGLGIIAIYYFLMVTGIKLSFNRLMSPLLGVWLSNIIVGLMGIYLLYKSYNK